MNVFKCSNITLLTLHFRVVSLLLENNQGHEAYYVSTRWHKDAKRHIVAKQPHSKIVAATRCQSGWPGHLAGSACGIFSQAGWRYSITSTLPALFLLLKMGSWLITNGLYNWLKTGQGPQHPTLCCSRRGVVRRAKMENWKPTQPWRTNLPRTCDPSRLPRDWLFCCRRTAFKIFVTRFFESFVPQLRKLNLQFSAWGDAFGRPKRGRDNHENKVMRCSWLSCF